jgi:hypothetical protein
VKGTPTLVPVVGDLAELGVGETGEHALGGLAVGAQLDATGVECLLEALGGELAKAGSQLLGLPETGADRGADQRKAFLSLWKKPGSCL